jgi:hypothetical protein
VKMLEPVVGGPACALRVSPARRDTSGARASDSFTFAAAAPSALSSASATCEGKVRRLWVNPKLGQFQATDRCP